MTIHILGIDAAWTAQQPSGVALLGARKNAKPELLALGRSYEEFLAAGLHRQSDWRNRVHGSPPAINALLAHCRKLSGALPRIIALDIPLSPQPLAGRRMCDNAVTSAYVSRGAGTHTPTARRPGPLAYALFQQLCAAGYHWHTHGVLPRQKRVFLETYPHPAIIELMQLPRRLAYKTSRRAQYWPEASPALRWRRLCRNLEALRDALAGEIKGVTSLVPAATAVRRRGGAVLLKGLEDMLDAVVCAWVGYQFWRGCARAYGNAEAAIWIPVPDFRSKKLVKPSKN
ncbi:MAG: DUF429 domain-containing protein [candidate division KSB1 bacterium]|nr:DUF429 domain-containing protein [candidate division KSB1 bacterium]MDZ7273575.1 DUF429 domain-containing protein [candidate division KSB1 bacterium]MDZ7286834.1 DUF429 domain-containing protein [candidate division KSB1 bacterium]MDZ7299809.1 DUF429 domain-containing protein [candidate division KSB1 bacterium]MDZ7309436.1 DUF429 domain-containing protein [candidate division KSB1 bacterium]